MKLKVRKFELLLFIILLIYSKSYYIQEGLDSSKIITNFTFGSNYYGRYLKEENIFEKILEHNSNLWIWLGNAVYLDIPEFNFFSNTRKSMDWDFIKYLYAKAKNNEFYQKMNEKIPVIGTWGDEEYGILNGDKENNFKEGYKQYYLDFLDADTLDQRRNYVKMGLYSTYSFGKGSKTVRFILLDLKYNQASYLKNETYDMLGKQQWNWLENIFKNTKETYTFICMPNQLLSNDRYIIKKWYTQSRKQIFDLIGKYKKNGVVFLSGGLGFAQILKTFCPLPNIGYNLYECTSSGLSHSNKFSSFYNNLYHNDYLIEGTNYNGINFGQVKINWGEGNNDAIDSNIELEIYDKDNNLVSSVKVNYSDLIYKNNTDEFYLDENNMKDIRYMNVHDGPSCEREINHRVRTLFMNIRYYFTHLSQMHIGLITTIAIILFFELLFRKHILFVIVVLWIIFIIYYISYLLDYMNYTQFKKKIQNSVHNPQLL